MKKIKESRLKKLLKGFKPPLNLTLSEWADKYMVLSAESSAEPGRWRTSRAPYQKGIMDAMTDDGTEEIIFMASAQVGKTAMLLNLLGYYMHQDPTSIIILMPTLEMASSFSKKRIAPMIRDTPVLRGLVKESRSKNAENTIKEKTFPGGYMVLVGANSPSSLASRPIRVTISDEIDRFPESAGEEGDPLALVDKRTTTYYNRKLVRVSTPTIRGRSKIEKLFNQSTMDRWNVPCPICGEYQSYEWARINFEPIGMECISCGEISSEGLWKGGSSKGKWISGAPNSKKRGFHINEFASPWRSWEDIIKDFKEKKDDPQTLMVWVNTTLGESWVDNEGKELDWETIMDRREEYLGEIPERVLLLTAGIDVQDNRIEVEVIGWGLNKESWGIEYKVIHGDPGKESTWHKLAEYLQKEFSYVDGYKLGITCSCIDTGGHHTQETYDFVAKFQWIKPIFAIKGMGGEGRPVLNGVKDTKDKKTQLWTLGVNSLKDILYSRLSLTEFGAGYCHFPKNEVKGYGENYFKSLTAEKKVVGMRKGKGKVEWVKLRKRNEGIDLRNYGTAALEIIDPNLEELLQADKKKRIDFLNNKRVEKPKPKRKFGSGL